MFSAEQKGYNFTGNKSEDVVCAQTLVEPKLRHTVCVILILTAGKPANVPQPFYACLVWDFQQI